MLVSEGAQRTPDKREVAGSAPPRPNRRKQRRRCDLRSDALCRLDASSWLGANGGANRRDRTQQESEPDAHCSFIIESNSGGAETSIQPCAAKAAVGVEIVQGYEVAVSSLNA